MLGLNDVKEKYDSIVSKFSMSPSTQRSAGEFLPGGLHLARGLRVLKHLDDGLRLQLQLLQLSHHGGPLLLQGYKIMFSVTSPA